MFIPWPPEYEMITGALGMSFSLWSIGRRQSGKPVHPDAAKADVGLLICGGLLIAVGTVRLLVL